MRATARGDWPLSMRMPMRVAAGLLALAALAGAVQAAPDFVAPPGSDRIDAPRSEPVDALQLADEAVALYAATCAAAGGALATGVDLALAAGLAPLPVDEAQRENLIGGSWTGQVFAPPGREALLRLAMADDGRCIVWVERADGPRVRAGFLRAVDEVFGPGSALRPTRERLVQAGGAWRQQTGFDLGAAPEARALDAITLVGHRPGVQLLRAAPAGP